MFTCLPGAMLLLRHILECSKGSSCERALLNDTFATAESHSWFNQAPPEALLLSVSRGARGERRNLHAGCFLCRYCNDQHLLECPLSKETHSVSGCVPLIEAVAKRAEARFPRSTSTGTTKYLASSRIRSAPNATGKTAGLGIYF